MQIPKLDKVVINVGCGADVRITKKVIDAIMTDLAAITGQKPIVCKAKKSVATTLSQLQKLMKRQRSCFHLWVLHLLISKRRIKNG